MEQFYKYFKQQNATPLNNILDPETNMETHSNERVEGPLDYPITDEEFKAAINKLKANKSLGIDNILNEVIKIGKDAIKGHLVNLFNLILDTSKYPTLWSFGLLVPIQKKDDRSKVKNYWGITLLSALKASSLHQSSKKGLYACIAQKGILKAEQGGFRKMHGTVGSIFTLKMLVLTSMWNLNHTSTEIYSFHASSTLEKPSTVYPNRNYSTKKVSKDVS